MSVTKDEIIIAEFEVALNNLLGIRMEERKRVLEKAFMDLHLRKYIDFQFKVVGR